MTRLATRIKGLHEHEVERWKSAWLDLHALAWGGLTDETLDLYERLNDMGDEWLAGASELEVDVTEQESAEWIAWVAGVWGSLPDVDAPDLSHWPKDLPEPPKARPDVFAQLQRLIASDLPDDDRLTAAWLCAMFAWGDAVRQTRQEAAQ
jgi:hypothetical protein